MKALAARPRDAEDIRHLTQVLSLRLRLLLEDIFSS
jgi:hypothetical protein